MSSKTSNRVQTRYICQSCGESFLRWEGQCRSCLTWNSLLETAVRVEPRPTIRVAVGPGIGGATTTTRLDAVGIAAHDRLALGVPELDRVLGGGLVPGSVVLVGGEPGIGKSTLLLQAAASVAGRVGSDRVLYATGEESASQVRLRAERLGLLDGPAAGIRVAAESSVDRIAEAALDDPVPALLVVDSIQTATVEELDAAAGSVGQVRAAAVRLMELAKPSGIAVVLVGHVTKDGTIAGPKTLEHLVDAVLTLDGDRFAAVRLLRASKNRFGSTEEVGVFEMGDGGLREVADPARAFLAQHDAPAPGSVVAATLEGSRPLLVEVQALVAPGPGGTPRRTTSGVDANRVALLVAVLGRRAGIGLSSHDVYVNLAGGLVVDEPGLDLPLALALASSLRDRAIGPETVAIGEVGLLGELRPVAGIERRLREAARLGFRRAVVPRPARDAARAEMQGLEVVEVGTLREAIEVAFGRAGQRSDGAPVGSARC